MIEFLIVAFAATLIYLSAAQRFRVFARFMGVQGVLIFGIAFLELNEMATGNLILVVSETLVFKGIVVPFMLFYIIRRTQVFKVHAQATPSFYILVLNAISLIVSVIIAYTLQNPFINIVFMTVALYALLSGLIIIVTHKLHRVWNICLRMCRAVTKQIPKVRQPHCTGKLFSMTWKILPADVLICRPIIC